MCHKNILKALAVLLLSTSANAAFYEVRQDCSVVDKAGTNLPKLIPVSSEYAKAVKFRIVTTDRNEEGFAYTSQRVISRMIVKYEAADTQPEACY